MCSYCGTIRNYRKMIADNFEKIRARKEQVDARNEEDHKALAFDCCNSSEALLLAEIIEILQYIKVIDR